MLHIAQAQGVTLTLLGSLAERITLKAQQPQATEGCLAQG